MKPAYTMPELRELCKKEYYSKFQQKMHMTMLYVTRLLLKTDVTPNQITTFWVLLQIVASGLLLFGVYWINVIAVLLYTFAMLLDYVDGQIARIKGIKTYKGIYLEELGIYFGNPIFFLCLGIGLYRTTHLLLYLILGGLAALFQLYNKAAIVHPEAYKDPIFREKIEKMKGSLSLRSAEKKKTDIIFFLFRRSQPFNVMFFGIILNFPQWVLIIYTALFFLDMVRKLYIQLKVLHRWDKELASQKTEK